MEKIRVGMRRPCKISVFFSRPLEMGVCDPARNAIN